MAIVIISHQWAPKPLKNSTLNTLFLIFSKTLKIAIFKKCFAIFNPFPRGEKPHIGDVFQNEITSREIGVYAK
jgi:hypothetical protein